MEHNHKNTDCYFFYYSTCKKGDFCPFRHEPSALGCETVCTYWQQGNCLNEHCNFRHMELKKNRKSIPCYWETQPGGCRKPHCPFMHKTVRAISNNPINPVKPSETAKSPNQEWLSRQDDSKFDGSSTESDQGRSNNEAGSFMGSPAVDPLIVKFDEDDRYSSDDADTKETSAKRSIPERYKDELVQISRVMKEEYLRFHRSSPYSKYRWTKIISSPSTGSKSNERNRVPCFNRRNSHQIDGTSQLAIERPLVSNVPQTSEVHASHTSVERTELNAAAQLAQNSLSLASEMNTPRISIVTPSYLKEKLHSSMPQVCVPPTAWHIPSVEHTSPLMCAEQSPHSATWLSGSSDSGIDHEDDFIIIEADENDMNIE